MIKYHFYKVKSHAKQQYSVVLHVFLGQRQRAQNKDLSGRRVFLAV